MPYLGMTLFMVVALTLATGCDTAPEMDYSSANLVPAGGTVSLDGRPLANAVVTFEASDGTFSYAMTDASGEYELQFDSAMKGVTPGPKTVRISTTRKILGLNTEEEESAETVAEGAKESALASPGPELVPPQYNSQSQLTVEVSPDRTTYDFVLNTKA